MRIVSRRRFGAVLAVVALLGVAAPLIGPVPAAADDTEVRVPTRQTWVWPVSGFTVAKPYVAPPHEYGPGHRGIDLAPAGAPAVRAPADGVVAFSGRVAGRAIVTIDHGDGLVTTLEPISSDVRAGTVVSRGEEIGTIAAGGHAAAGTLHFGVRLHGEYINPLLVLDGLPRAVLLPCCE